VNLLCEGLPQYGLVLVPPSSEGYDAFLADIQRRLDDPAEGSPPFPERFRPRIVQQDRPTSAILLNGSAKTIAGLHGVWRFETETGRVFRRSMGLLSPHGLLLPFSMRDQSTLKLYGYWNTILPGSKRYVGESGMVGDNTDVRPPGDDEKWRGGMTGSGGGGGEVKREPMRQVTLVLDGVFFLDGELAGPDEGKMFEQTVATAEAHRLVAGVVREGHERRLPATQILAEIENVTGVAPEHPPVPPNFRNAAATQGEFRTAALQTIAHQLGRRRRFPQPGTDDQAVAMILSWNDTVVPEFRRS
jgi:hypothetical protein